MNVLLVVSPFFNDIYRFFPLGIAYIASALKHAHIAYEICDMNSTGMTVGDFDNFWQKRKGEFDVVAISSMINNYYRTKQIVHSVRSNSPETPVIVGGKIVNVDKTILFEDLKPDILVIGDGEETIINVLNRINTNYNSLGEVRGISFLDSNKKIVTTEPALPVKGLHNYRIPYMDFDMKLYVSRQTDVSHGFISMQYVSSRGCPFTCTYCNNSTERQNKKVVYHDLKNMESDFAYLKKFGLEHIFFCDDIFTTNKLRMTQLCDLLKSMNIRYSISTRLDTLNEEKIAKLNATGCYYIMLGIETASQKIAKLMHKQLNIEKFQRNIELLQKTNIIVSCNFIIGYLGENETTLFETKDFILRNNLIYNTYFATAYPGTTLYHMIKDKIPHEKEYLYKLFDLDMQTQYLINMSELPKKKLLRLRKKILVDSVINIMGFRSLILIKILKLFAYLYWNIVQFNSSRNSWLKRLTDYVNQVILKPHLSKTVKKSKQCFH